MPNTTNWRKTLTAVISQESAPFFRWLHSQVLASLKAEKDQLASYPDEPGIKDGSSKLKECNDYLLTFSNMDWPSRFQSNLLYHIHYSRSSEEAIEKLLERIDGQSFEFLKILKFFGGVSNDVDAKCQAFRTSIPYLLRSH